MNNKRTVFLLLVTLGCGVEPGPVQVMALVPSASGGYENRAVELKTLTSLSNMSGSVAHFIVGARELDPDLSSFTKDQLLALQTNTDQRLKVFLQNPGREAHPTFIKQNGVYWATDFDSWEMASAYYALEKTAAYFQGLVDDPPEFHQMRVYYSAEIYSHEPSWFPPDNEMIGNANNAAYLSAIDAVLMTPATSTSTLPIGQRVAVLAHESSHRVFGQRALAGFFLSPFKTVFTSNLGRSLNEGLADFHAFGVTCFEASGCRPGFMKDLSTDDLSRQRDLARSDACMTSTLRTSLQSDPLFGAGVYTVGSIFAASLYQTGVKTGLLKDLQRGVIAAYTDDAPASPGFRQLIFKAVADPTIFDEAAIVDSIASHLANPTLRREWCGTAADRLRLECSSFPCAKLPSCPADSVRGSACPDLVMP